LEIAHSVEQMILCLEALLGLVAKLLVRKLQSAVFAFFPARRKRVFAAAVITALGKAEHGCCGWTLLKRTIRANCARTPPMQKTIRKLHTFLKHNKKTLGLASSLIVSNPFVEPYQCVGSD